jgi:hypothetical protein
VWIDLAAGIPSDDSEQSLRHAANCDHCASLLREAAADLTDELTPQEEILLARLKSLTSAWQARVASQLGGITPSEVPPIHKGRWPSTPIVFFSPARLGFALVLTALIALAIWEHQSKEHLLAERRQSVADIQRLRQDLIQERSRIAELTDRGGDGSGKPQLSAPPPMAKKAVISLALESGLTRGGGTLKRLAVPPGTQFVRVTLRLTGVPRDLLREELLTVDRRTKWSQELRASAVDRRSNSLSLVIPAYLLSPEDYLIVVTARSGDHFDEAASYSFRVVP